MYSDAHLSGGDCEHSRVLLRRERGAALRVDGPVGGAVALRDTAADVADGVRAAHIIHAVPLQGGGGLAGRRRAARRVRHREAGRVAVRHVPVSGRGGERRVGGRRGLGRGRRGQEECGQRVHVVRGGHDVLAGGRRGDDCEENRERRPRER